jgi:hypothetical protein
MKIVYILSAASIASMALFAGTNSAETIGHIDHAKSVSDDVIAKQRVALDAQTNGAGYGPQSPRNIEAVEGTNARAFSAAPDRSLMNLCNIHFHENAEHRGGEFTTYAGNGDGHGHGTGFRYDGLLAEAELASFGQPVGVSEHGELVPGDTIEIHFVYSTAQVEPGPTLAACVTEAINNPQLRVETVVAVLVNDETTADLTEIAHIEQLGGYYQVPNLPENLGDAVSYAGSTTGPAYNETASPYQVTWNVRPKVLKLHIGSVADWLKDNPFDEEHAHGVRSLVLSLDLLSRIH